MGGFFSLFSKKPDEEFTFDSSREGMFSELAAKKAILIGINYDNDENFTDDLRGCENDVQRIIKFLVQNLNFKPTDIYVLNTTLATKRNIEKSLKNLLNYALENRDSQIFIHYSGHGTSFKCERESDGRSEAICPVDHETNGLITDEWLKTEFIENLPNDCNLFCLVDCCHSGTNMNLSYYHDGLCFKRDFNNKPCSANVVKISGCLDDQVSYDYYNNNMKIFNGALTNAFIETFDADESIENHIERIRSYLSKQNFPQIPSLTSSKKFSSQYLVQQKDL